MKVYDLCGWFGCIGIGLVIGSIADYSGMTVKQTILMCIGSAIVYMGLLYTIAAGDRTIRWG
jgi:uncharacterized membrane protein (Fun14 family)